MRIQKSFLQEYFKKFFENIQENEYPNLLGNYYFKQNVQKVSRNLKECHFELHCLKLALLLFLTEKETDSKKVLPYAFYFPFEKKEFVKICSFIYRELGYEFDIEQNYSYIENVHIEDMTDEEWEQYKYFYQNTKLFE